MSRPAIFLVVLTVPWWLAPEAGGQPVPPPDPANPQVPDEVPTETGAAREDAPAGAPDGAAPPAARTTANRVAAGESVQVAQAEPTTDVPVGAISVQVVDVSGDPVPGQPVRVGILKSLNAGRDERTGETDAAGRVVFSDLPTGTGQAYRVTTLYDGANYGSTPFQLPTDRGYRVRLLRLGTTTDTTTVLESVGLAAVEIRDQRLHVTQRTTLMNFGEETVVFAGDGVSYPLPEGFISFQTQPVMTDQRLVAGDDGFDLRGSLPPGQTTLVWTFDVPLRAGTQDLRLPSPFRTFRYRVLAEASEEMGLLVDDLPEPQPVEQQGRRFLVTEVQRRPGDAPLETIFLRLTGIPGPGPGRWLAVAAAVLLALGGLGLAIVRPGSAVGSRRRAREARRAALLDEAAELARLARSGEIGPEYHARESGRIVTELAQLMREDDDAASGDVAGAEAHATAPPAGTKRAQA